MNLKISLIARLAVVLAAGLISFSANASVDGVWSETPAGLPYCRYDGKDKDVNFLLGNYRMNVIAHSDGIYDILSGERVWARFNADSIVPDRGRNRATLTLGRNELELVGSDSDVSGDRYAVYTGIGFARYDYRLKGGIRCSRMISVLPSDEVNEGSPCFVITVTLSNTGHVAKTLSYEEVFSPMYVPVADQMLQPVDRAFSYPYVTDISFRCLKAYFTPEAQRFMQIPSPEARYRHEVAPQSLFLYSPDAFLSISDGEFKAQYFDMKLKSGEKRVINIVIGLNMGDDAKTMAETVLKQAVYGQFGLFEAQWKNRLPNFYLEKNRALRKDMYMSAHSLEASAVYDSYFDLTFVPGESGNVYHTGENLSNMDHIQRAFPLCYINPELAKSSILYVMNHACSDGRIAGGNTGYGYIPSYYMPGYYDLHPALMNLVSEYLRITGDYDFLDESLVLYSGERVKVMQMLERFFIYLRDELPLEADSKSLIMNLSLASSYLPALADTLKQSARASEDFILALYKYADMAWEAFRKSEGYIEEEDNSNEKSKALYNYLRSLE